MTTNKTCPCCGAGIALDPDGNETLYEICTRNKWKMEDVLSYIKMEYKEDPPLGLAMQPVMNAEDDATEPPVSEKVKSVGGYTSFNKLQPGVECTIDPNNFIQKNKVHDLAVLVDNSVDVELFLKLYRKSEDGRPKNDPSLLFHQAMFSPKDTGDGIGCIETSVVRHNLITKRNIEVVSIFEKESESFRNIVDQPTTTYSESVKEKEESDQLAASVKGVNQIREANAKVLGRTACLNCGNENVMPSYTADKVIGYYCETCKESF